MEGKGTTGWGRWHTVIFTSNIPPEMWWESRSMSGCAESQKQAFWRRLHQGTYIENEFTAPPKPTKINRIGGLHYVCDEDGKPLGPLEQAACPFIATAPLPDVEFEDELSEPAPKRRRVDVDPMDGFNEGPPGLENQPQTYRTTSPKESGTGARSWAGPWWSKI